MKLIKKKLFYIKTPVRVLDFSILDILGKKAGTMLYINTKYIPQMAPG